jgi:hypothetical protein
LIFFLLIVWNLWNLHGLVGMIKYVKRFSKTGKWHLSSKTSKERLVWEPGAYNDRPHQQLYLLVACQYYILTLELDLIQRDNIKYYYFFSYLYSIFKFFFLLRVWSLFVWSIGKITHKIWNFISAFQTTTTTKITQSQIVQCLD